MVLDVIHVLQVRESGMLIKTPYRLSDIITI